MRVRRALGKAKKQTKVGRGEVTESINEREANSLVAAGRKTEGENVLVGRIKETHHVGGPHQVHPTLSLEF